MWLHGQHHRARAAQSGDHHRVDRRGYNYDGGVDLNDNMDVGLVFNCGGCTRSLAQADTKRGAQPGSPAAPLAVNRAIGPAGSMLLSYSELTTFVSAAATAGGRGANWIAGPFACSLGLIANLMNCWRSGMSLASGRIST